MKQQGKVNGALGLYLQWPIVLTLLLICMNIGMFFYDKKVAGFMAVFVVCYAIIAGLLYYFKRPAVEKEIVEFAQNYNQVQRKLLQEMAIPYAIMDEHAAILWKNDEFGELFGGPSEHEKFTKLVPAVKLDNLPTVEQDTRLHTMVGERNYEVCMRLVTIPEFTDETPDTEYIPGKLYAVYLYDETEICALKKQNEDQKLISGLLYIDNYEETFENIDEVRRSLLTALVDRKINKFMVSIDAIIKKLEKDKYIFVFQHKYLAQMEANKFAILEEVRGSSVGGDSSTVTISMGLGVNADSYLSGYELARSAIDLALGRGGDQAVVKNGHDISYYGGKSVQIEKTTRVKARVKAYALKEFMEGKERVVVMGHAVADIDCLGAAIGVYRIAKFLGKKAHIVVGEMTGSIRPMLDKLNETQEYEEDTFVTKQKAMGLVDNTTLLVVVDVNRPSYTECEELLSQTRSIVILDHHRQTSEAIPNAVLSYIEPYASSACELVAEILQYIGNGLKLKQLEADAMYAGIMIDTNNFLTKTGVRTFEASAYLRRSGADITRIRKLFRTDLSEYHAKAKTVAAAEIFEDKFAFSVTYEEDVENPMVVAAQAANELLSINNVVASFVFAEHNGKIYVSARSIDELNVQVVMEKLGGGGHMSVAGAQFEDCDVHTAVERVKNVLFQMMEDGEIK